MFEGRATRPETIERITNHAKMIYRLTANRSESVKKLCQHEGVTIEKTEEERIKGLWNLHIVLSDGGHYSIGPHGGLWHYLSPSQREVEPNEWTTGIDKTLTDSDFVSEIRERRKKE
jgi:hypothetical protein